MCFSAEADFVSSAVIGAIGVATLTKVEHPRELALGALPLALAAHQAVEGVVWLGKDGHASAAATELVVDLYVAFAWVLLPVLLPLCLWLVEPDRIRRRAMVPFLALGVVVAANLASAAFSNGVTAHIVGKTLEYRGAGDLAVEATVLYVIATMAPPLLCSHRAIRLFGVLNLGAVGVIAWIQSDGVTSLWCLWAACVSVLIYVQFSMWRLAPDERSGVRNRRSGPGFSPEKLRGATSSAPDR